MLDVIEASNLRIVIWIKEVDMVREPTDTENDNENDQHFDNLEKKKIF